jgi:hypothetical protein
VILNSRMRLGKAVLLMAIVAPNEGVKALSNFDYQNKQLRKYTKSQRPLSDRLDNLRTVLAILKKIQGCIRE